MGPQNNRHLPAQGLVLIGVQAPCTDTNRRPLRGFEGGDNFLVPDLLSQSLCEAVGDKQCSFMEFKSQREHHFGEKKTYRPRRGILPWPVSKLHRPAVPSLILCTEIAADTVFPIGRTMDVDDLAV